MPFYHVTGVTDDIDPHCILELTKMGLVCVALWFYRIHNCLCSFSRCHIHERWMNGDRGNEDTTILQIQAEKKLQNAKINASGKMLTQSVNDFVQSRVVCILVQSRKFAGNVFGNIGKFVQL